MCWQRSKAVSRPARPERFPGIASAPSKMPELTSSPQRFKSMAEQSETMPLQKSNHGRGMALRSRIDSGIFAAKSFSCLPSSVSRSGAWPDAVTKRYLSQASSSRKCRIPSHAALKTASEVRPESAKRHCKLAGSMSASSAVHSPSPSKSRSSHCCAKRKVGCEQSSVFPSSKQVVVLPLTEPPSDSFFPFLPLPPALEPDGLPPTSLNESVERVVARRW
mmetsp:Transcript_12242/g.26990  ORF Transcript_12242/g.26990 Transcript_12242/m.26990 type:complete len:220 (+) Transcript_12242:1083-1742(+)